MLRKYIYPILLSILIVCTKILSKNNDIIDNFYSTKIYNPTSVFLRRIFGSINFSVGDIIYTLVIVIIIYKLFKAFKVWKTNKLILTNLICIILICFIFLFNILWGLNYYRKPFHERSNFENSYTESDLKIVTDTLIKRLNILHLKYTNDKDSLIVIPINTEIILSQAASGYEVLSRENKDFLYLNSSIKTSAYSTLLSYMGFGGYINPFTNEAHVNAKLPKTNMLVTASHEIAHQIGIGSETEANFYGYLAAKNNPNLYFDYAAANFALRYCLRNYPFKNENEYENYIKKINPGILKDWNRSREFWLKYESFIDRTFQFIYDKFLKVNQQTYGIDSYSMFINLLIQYEIEEISKNKKG